MKKDEGTEAGVPDAKRDAATNPYISKVLEL